MRLVILTQYFLPEMGAPQSRLYELAKGLQAFGWEVDVVTAMPNYPTGRIFSTHKGKFKFSETIEGIPIHRYWLYASNSSRILPRIINMISFSFTSLFAARFVRLKKPLYILVESPPLTLAFSAWLLSKYAGSRLIMNVSDLWPLSAKELGAISDGIIYRQLERLEHFLYRQSFLSTGQSDEIVRHIQPLAPRVHLFRNGVDTNRFSVDNYDPEKRKCIVYAGLLGVAQGIYAICQHINFNELGVEFHIYGSGAEQKKVEQFALENPESGVKYLGVLHRNEVPRLLSAYGGALIPLVKNIFGAVPSKIYEAMAAGLPILFSGEGEGAEIIGRHQAGWVNKAGDWSSLQKNINSFAQLATSEFIQLRENNRMVAVHYFDRNKQVKQFNDLLINL